MAMPLRCGGSSRLFRGSCFDPIVANLKGSSSHPPLFVLVFFLFCALSSWDWGQGNPRVARVFAGTCLSFHWLCLLTKKKKTVFFTLRKGCFCHFSVSPFLSPCLLSLLLFTHSLSLSLSLLFLVFVSFLVFLCLFFLPSFFVVFFLPCFFAFCFMKRTTSKYYISMVSFHQLFVLFWFPVWLCLSSPFSYLFFSLFQLCVWVNINVFISKRRPFGNKTQISFCSL